MKRETLHHPKTYDLADRLGCSRPTALGYLTLLWDYTGEVTPQGNIGRWSNAVIARALDYEGNADDLIAALVDSGWLDESEEHRLLVHHWPDHCENWVKKKCSRMGVNVSAYYQSADSGAPVASRCPDSGAPACAESRRDDAGSAPEIDPSYPIQSEPIQSEPNQTPARGDVSSSPPKEPSRARKPRATKPPAKIPGALDTPAFTAAWADYSQHRREKRAAMTPTAERAALKKLTGWGVVRAVAALEYSTAAGYTGIIEPDRKSNARPETDYTKPCVPL